jgi:hypothetical protein
MNWLGLAFSEPDSKDIFNLSQNELFLNFFYFRKITTTEKHLLTGIFALKNDLCSSEQLFLF